MHLSVALKTRRIPMDVPTDETVFGLKSRIDIEIRVPPVHQQLFFNGSILNQDDSHLQYYGVESGSEVHVRVEAPNARSASMVNISERVFGRPHASVSMGDLRVLHVIKDVTEDDLSDPRLRLQDCFFQRMELVPGGFRKVERDYREIVEALERDREARARPAPKTVIPEKPDAPCCDPMPFRFTMWSS